MKKVLIATTNNDKYDAVSKIFRMSIFPTNKYIIEKLTNDMNVPDVKESGSNVERARKKAINAFNYLKKFKYDYIVGLDDALLIKNRLEPNIKEYINKILFENFIDDGEEYGFSRAYCIIDKNNKMYEVALKIPYIYHSLNSEFEMKTNSYPLSKVAYPIGYDKPICELSEKEEIEYYLKYVKKGLINLKIDD